MTQPSWGVAPWRRGNLATCGRRATRRAVSPLGKGFLTGKIDETTSFDGSDFRTTVPRLTPENRKANQALVDLLRTMAQRKQATPAQIALAWLLARKPWIVPIPGTTKLHRLEENLGGLAVELTPDCLGEIERACASIALHGDCAARRSLLRGRTEADRPLTPFLRTWAGVKRAAARALIDQLTAERSGLLSIQVLMEFYVTVTGKLARRIPGVTAAAIVDDFGTWRVFSPVVGDVGVAAALAERHAINFWDAMIVRAAQALEASVIWSEDLNAQQHSGIPLRSPLAGIG